jgi:hypothetical protein
MTSFVLLTPCRQLEFFLDTHKQLVPLLNDCEYANRKAGKIARPEFKKIMVERMLFLGRYRVPKQELPYISSSRILIIANDTKVWGDGIGAHKKVALKFMESREEYDLETSLRDHIFKHHLNQRTHSRLAALKDAIPTSNTEVDKSCPPPNKTNQSDVDSAHGAHHAMNPFLPDPKSQAAFPNGDTSSNSQNQDNGNASEAHLTVPKFEGGFLIKSARSGFMKGNNWTKRFFVQNGLDLVYYKDEIKAGHSLDSAKEIKLPQGCKAIIEDLNHKLEFQFPFRLEHPVSGKVLVSLAAQTESQRDLWVEWVQSSRYLSKVSATAELCPMSNHSF